MFCILVATVLLGVFDAVACNCDACEPTSVMFATRNCVAFNCFAGLCQSSAFVGVGEQCERASNETATCICVDRNAASGFTSPICQCDSGVPSTSTAVSTSTSTLPSFPTSTAAPPPQRTGEEA